MVIEPGNSNVNKGGVQTQTTGSNRAKAPANPASAPDSTRAQSSTDSVSLSSEAQSMGRLEAAVKDSAEVDERKVAELRQAIAEGRYQVDADTIAGKMLEQDAQL